MRRSMILAAALALAVAAPATARDVQQIMVTNPEIRASLGGSDTPAAYMVIRNMGAKPDHLVGVSCACAAKAEVHVTRASGGMTTMRPAGRVALPAHGEVILKPGGMHVMLTGVKGRLVDGARQPMILTFEKAGPMRVDFRVQATIAAQGTAPQQMAPMPGMEH